MILALILALQVNAAPMPEKWSTPIVDGTPVAAFFDVGSASVFVSVKDGKRARVDKFDLSGKLLKQGIVTAKGEAGPLRAHFGKIYWVTGALAWSFDPAGGKKVEAGRLGEGFGKPTDLAVTRDGRLLVSFDTGMLTKNFVEGNSSSTYVQLDPGPKIAGMFLLDSELYLLRGGQLQTFTPATSKLGKAKLLCKSDCLGLEKSSGGAWIVAEGNTLREFGEKTNSVLVEGREPVGRFAYVYDKDPTNDMIVVPYPQSKTLRAYKFP